MSIAFTPLQQRVLACPHDIVLPGGRNSGKSVAAFAKLIQHATLYEHSEGLFVRRTFPALDQPWRAFQELLHKLNLAHTANQTRMQISYSNGAHTTFAPLDSREYWEERFRGSAYQCIAIDEVASFTDGFHLLDMLISNLRHPTYPCILIYCSNPGPAQAHFKKRLLDPAPGTNGEPFTVPDTGRTASVFHSTLNDNPHAGSEAEATIRAFAAGNQALYEQHRFGNFAALEGAAFLIEERNRVRWPRFSPKDFPLKLLIGHDHGSTSPWASVWLARFREAARGPDGRTYPAGSYVAFHETHNADPSVGYVRAAYQSTVQDVAGNLLRDAEYLGFAAPPTIYADTQMWQQIGSAVQPHLASELSKYGLRVTPATKGRVKDSVQRIRELLHAAGTEDAGLFIDSRCDYLLTALGTAPLDPRDAESIDARFYAKHAIDALAYGINSNITNTGWLVTPMGQDQIDVRRMRKAHETQVSHSRQVVMGRCRRGF